ncbi:MAG: alpha/beta fold hydrolase [Actinomycetota bacterium]
MSTAELEFKDELVEAAGMKIHVTDVGSGDPIVMLHGGGPGASSMSNFKGNVDNLVAAGFRLLLVDQPGFGGSSKDLPDGSYFELAAKAVKGVLDAKGITKSHLLGNSLGGGTAVKVAIDYPEVADRLVLMGPGGAAVNILTSGDIVESVAKTVAEFYASPGLESIRRFVDLMVYDSSNIPDSVLEERLAAATEPEAMAFMKQLFVKLATDPGKDLWKDVDKIHHRSLLVWGRDDRVLPLDSALLAFHRMPDVRLVAFSKCGHWVQAEKQEEFDRLVIDFLTAP